MLKAYGLAKSRATDSERTEAGYFQVVRELIIQLTEQGGPQPGSKSKLTLKQVNERINALLEQNIVHSDGVINLFKVEDETVSVFDPKFLASLSRMKKQVNERINALLEQNIVHSDGVINLFKVEDETVSVFDPKFLASLSRMK